MAVTDLWFRKVNGKRTPTPLNGVGKRWQARWRDANDVQRKKNFVNKDDAERHLANLRITPEVRASRLTVGQQYAVWIRTKQGLSSGHVSNYESKWRIHVQPDWHHRLLSEVRHSEVAAWAAELSAATSPSVARQALQVLSGVFALAVRDGLVAADPASGVTVKALQKRQGRPLSSIQVQELALACGPDGVAVRTLAFTGLRWGELAGLRVRDLDVKRGRLSVSRSVGERGGVATIGPTKSGKAREVGVPPGLLTELTTLAAGADPDSPLLPAARGGIRRHSRFYKRFKAAVDQLGFGDLRPHDLRHTAATLAIQSGADVKVVQRMLGHASATLTVDLYGHLWEKGVDDVAQRMGEFEQPRLKIVG
jgi:integrase